jgi:hypothetical protein
MIIYSISENNVRPNLQIGKRDPHMKIRYGSLLLILAALLITAGYAHSNTTEDSDAVKWFEKGHRAFIEKRWDVVIFTFDKAILLNPNYTEAYLIVGLPIVVLAITIRLLQITTKPLT